MALSALLYGLNEGSWLLFVLLFLVPDVSMLGYLAGGRVGAASYNLFHTYAASGLLAALGLLAESLPKPRRLVRGHRVLGPTRCFGLARVRL